MRDLPFKMARGSRLEKWRAETFWTKEPETIAWIDDFEPGQFWDVGANVGIYSLYCVSRHYKKIHVHAFEPYHASFQSLEQNVLANGFAHEITPAVIALGESSGFTHFYVPESGAGASGGQIRMPVNEHGEGFAARELYIVGMLTADAAAAQTGVPNYVKIDVDGRERDVLRGMGRTLLDPALRSVLVEINRNRAELEQLFKDCGFTTENKYNTMKDHSRVRRQREGIRAQNIVFTRKP